MNPTSVCLGEGKMSSAGFFVDTQGHCFLCLNRVSSTVTPTPTYSLQYLSRYLKLNLGKVLKEEMQLSPEVVAKLEKGKLRAKLCEGCASLNDRFSELHEQLERIRMEIGPCLKGIHGRLIQAVESGVAEELQILMMAENSLDQMMALQVAEGLRNEAIQKCSNKLASLKPRVLVENLKLAGAEAVPTCFKDLPLLPSKSLPGQPLDNGVVEKTEAEGAKMTFYCIDDDSQTHAKLECDICHLQVEDLSTHLYTAHFDVQQQTNDSTVKESEPTILIKPELQLSPSQSIHQNFRHKCFLCDKEFTHPGALIRHRKNVHLGKRLRNEMPKLSLKKEPSTATSSSPLSPPQNKNGQSYSSDATTGTGKNLSKVKNLSIHQPIRHRCHQCGKTFARICSLRQHHISIHLGRRYQCPICSKSFNFQGSLAYHYEKSPACLEGKLKLPKPAPIARPKPKQKQPSKSTESLPRTRPRGTLSSGKGIGRWQFRFIPATGQYRCQMCEDENFADLKAWNAHFKTVHKKTECADCGREFETLTKLQLHRESVHLRIRYKCEDCDTIFSQKGGLQLHSRTHCRKKSTSQRIAEEGNDGIKNEAILP